jgi:hypothetical protein
VVDVTAVIVTVPTLLVALVLSVSSVGAVAYVGWRIGRWCQRHTDAWIERRIAGRTHADQVE